MGERWRGYLQTAPRYFILELGDGKLVVAHGWLCCWLDKRSSDCKLNTKSKRIYILPNPIIYKLASAPCLMTTRTALHRHRA